MCQIDILGTSIEHHNVDVTQGHFSQVLWTSLNKFYANIEDIFYVSL